MLLGRYALLVELVELVELVGHDCVLDVSGTMP